MLSARHLHHIGLNKSELGIDKTIYLLLIVIASKLELSISALEPQAAFIESRLAIKVVKIQNILLLNLNSNKVSESCDHYPVEKEFYIVFEKMA